MIVALDLSLTATGMVAAEPSWDLDWKRVHRGTCGFGLSKATLADQVNRLRCVARDVRSFCVRFGATEVWAEDLPTARAHQLVQLGELRGVVRVELADVGLELRFISQSSARKFLLGKLPRANRKAHVVEALKAAGADFADADQADAFTVLNWALSEQGAPCLTHLLFRPEAQ